MTKPLTFNKTETDHLVRCIDLAIASAKRGANTAKSPEFKQLYERGQNELNALRIKVTEAA